VTGDTVAENKLRAATAATASWGKGSGVDATAKRLVFE